MAFNLRIPAGMDLLARTRAEQVGISMNALILIALDQYLKSGATPSMSDLLPGPSTIPPTNRPLDLEPGEPVLSKPPTKKEIAAYHNWKRERDAAAAAKAKGKPKAVDDRSQWRGKGFVETAMRRLNSDHPEAL